MTVLRVIAILVALGGVLDPALSLSRPVPTLVRLHVDRSDPDAADVEARLRAAMHDPEIHSKHPQYEYIEGYPHPHLARHPDMLLSCMPY